MDVRRRQYKQDVYLPVKSPFSFVTFLLGEQKKSLLNKIKNIFKLNRRDKPPPAGSANPRFGKGGIIAAKKEFRKTSAKLLEKFLTIIYFLWLTFCRYRP